MIFCIFCVSLRLWMLLVRIETCTSREIFKFQFFWFGKNQQWFWFFWQFIFDLLRLSSGLKFNKIFIEKKWSNQEMFNFSLLFFNGIIICTRFFSSALIFNFSDFYWIWFLWNSSFLLISLEFSWFILYMNFSKWLYSWLSLKFF